MLTTPAEPNPARQYLRVGAAALLGLALVVGVFQLPDGAEREGSLRASYERGERSRVQSALAKVGDGHDHDHNDPATKNSLSRGGEVSPSTQDPTTAAQAARSTAYVASQRRMRDPKLVKRSARIKRPPIPTSRYGMASGCYTLQAPTGRYVKRSGAGLTATAGQKKAERFFFRAVDLGVYLLYGKKRDYLAGAAPSSFAATPSAATEWTAAKSGKKFTLSRGGARLTLSGKTVTTGPAATKWRLHKAGGCARYPEAQISVSGGPHAGITPYQEVRGYVDAHTHGMAFEFLGGQVHCGKPWDRYGVKYALVDCLDHSATGGYGAALETALGGEPGHDPVGWPTFQDWPAPESLTHEGTYYRWLERSWRGGQRLFVNLLVENNKLCELYPLKRNSCDDMDSLRLQARHMYELQRYIDAQSGGPGKGWYRIVKSPWEARKVINSGKMAVVMGIETSVPFGCTFKKLPAGDLNQCDPAGIDRQLDEMHKLGVRQMELVNKFDNALSGVAGDGGATGVVVNAANFLETGTFWNMQHCEPADGESADKSQYAAPDISAGQQDALFGAIGQVSGVLNLAAAPLYGPPAHCNARGLTDLGSHLVNSLADKRMLIDPDHMSVKARDSLLDILEARSYSGALSSHSWSTPDAYPRIYKLGGYIAPYAGDSTGFVEKWRRHLTWADPRFYFGFGYGADINGLGAQGNARGAGVPNPVTYPFKGFNGVTIKKQKAGKRVYDLNVDGVAQYGLYPDWIQDISLVAGADGSAIKDDMMRGAEAYLQTWERAEGIKADSCRNPGYRLPAKKFAKRVKRGQSIPALMRRVGQPYERLGSQFTYCTKNGKRVVEVSSKGRVLGLRR